MLGGGVVIVGEVSGERCSPERLASSVKARVIACPSLLTKCLHGKFPKQAVAEARQNATCNMRALPATVPVPPFHQHH